MEGAGRRRFASSLAPNYVILSKIVKTTIEYDDSTPPYQPP